MAKTFFMGEGTLTDEEREQLAKAREEAEQKSKEFNALQQKLLKEEKEVTLTELLNTTLQPQEDRIIVWRDKAERFTEGGLLKPDEALQKERPSRGTVIAVGPGKDNQNLTQELLCAILDELEEPGPKGSTYVKRADVFKGRVLSSTANYKPGDKIMFGRFAGTPIEDPETGEELLIMRPHDIFVKL